MCPRPYFYCRPYEMGTRSVHCLARREPSETGGDVGGRAASGEQRRAQVSSVLQVCDLNGMTYLLRYIRPAPAPTSTYAHFLVNSVFCRLPRTSFLSTLDKPQHYATAALAHTIRYSFRRDVFSSWQICKYIKRARDERRTAAKPCAVGTHCVSNSTGRIISGASCLH